MHWMRFMIRRFGSTSVLFLVLRAARVVAPPEHLVHSIAHYSGDDVERVRDDADSDAVPVEEVLS